MEVGLKVGISYNKTRIQFLLFWYIIVIVPFPYFYFYKMLIRFSWDDDKGSTVRVRLSSSECIVLCFFSTRLGVIYVLINYFSTSS